MNTYWYMFDDFDISVLLTTGLFPANMRIDGDKGYSNRRRENDYFKETYERNYGKVAGRYRHYGIYTTPIDLPRKAKGGPHLRIRFSTNNLADVVCDIRVGKLVANRVVLQSRTPPFLLKGVAEQSVTHMLKVYTSSYVDMIWNKVDQMKFRFLPQFIHFGDVPLMFNSKDVEEWD